VAKLKVTPQDNSTSQSLKAGGDKNLAHLKTLRPLPRIILLVHG
jgi:putative membrane protein